MGFLLRAAAVIGIIFALSPVSQPGTETLARDARAALAGHSQAAAHRAAEACLARTDICARLAAEAATAARSSALAPAPLRPSPAPLR